MAGGSVRGTGVTAGAVGRHSMTAITGLLVVYGTTEEGYSS
jgi:hypothetical protein